MSADRLRLRPLRYDDEAAFRRAHAAMAAEGFTFGIEFEDGTGFAAYVDTLERRRRGLDLDGRLVPSTFVVADVGGEIVGRSSIRHELNEFLAHEGGHIGYGVLAEHRRRGYATEILRQSLAIAAAHGVDRALVTCDDDNVGSAAVIERCGGVFESHTVGESGKPMRRYWIDQDPTAPAWASAALVTIDVQADTLDGGALEVAGTSAAVPAISRLCGAFRAAGRPIVHVVRLYAADGSNAERSRRALARGPVPVLRPGTPGRSLAAGIPPEGAPALDDDVLLAGGLQPLGEGEVAMYKPRWGAFYATPLDDHLRDLGVTTVVVAGCNFPNCPRTTI
jgi:predicted acetyltransferase/nicotinamidase-related amidase